MTVAAIITEGCGPGSSIKFLLTGGLDSGAASAVWNYGAQRVSAADPRFPVVANLLMNEKEHRRQIADTVNRHNQGKFNATADITLNANATTTTLTDARIGFNSSVSPGHATTANGAAAVAAGIWISNLTKGSCTINHANSANTDQTIRFTIIG